MVEVIYYLAASLDGFIATPDGGVDWLTPYQEAGEDHGFSELVASVDAVLMGSRTYEQALGFGVHPSSGKPCRVFSRRPLKPSHPEIQVTAKSPRDVLADLDEQGLRRACWWAARSWPPPSARRS